VIAAVVGSVLIAIVFLLSSGGDEQDDQSGAEVPDDCTEIVIAASSEKAGLLVQLAGEWNATRPEAAGSCVGATVVAKASGAAADALAQREWDEQVDGPRPDVWSPAASSWAGLTRQARTDADLPDILPTQAESIATTPLVIAMPRPMAEALGWPDEQIGWQDLAALTENPQGWGAAAHPEWGAFKLGKTNPYFSTSGLNATIGSYFAATGLASDLTVQRVQDPATQDFVRTVESAVVHYGDTTLTFLDNMAAAADQGRGLTYVSAVTVEEKSVLDYNLGNPTGDPAALEAAVEPDIPLVAVYPEEGTLLSDNPWFILQADWVDDTKREGAEQFAAFIRSDEAQTRFTEAGFRSYTGEPGPVLTQENGFLPEGPATILAPPEPSVLGVIQQSWDDLRKRARVLMVLDVSGSMGADVASVGATRLELAAEATATAVAGFADTDEVGLWIFATERGPTGEPWASLVPIGPGAQSKAAIQQSVAGLVPDGGTALYATTREAQEQMLAELDTGRINAIVLLSDGRNEYPPDTDLDSLLRQLEGESADTSIRVFTIGYGSEADAAALEAIAEASAAEYYDASDPTSIDQVLTSVLSNF
jgi:Ca-activated chloride channel family protein